MRKALAVVLFIVGLNMAGAEGPYFPALNLLGAGISLLSIPVGVGFVKPKGGRLNG